MTYRPITQQEIPVAADIQARAYSQDAEGYVERYQQGDRVDWNDVRLLRNEQGEAVAALNLFERSMSLSGAALKAGLVAGVAVPPDLRRRGYAGRLMNGLLDELYDKQLPISLLYPFSVAFYGRMGYALVNLNWFLDIPPRALPEYPERVTVRRATPDDHAAIRACYERAYGMPINNGWLSRTDWEWEHSVWREERQAVVCPADEGVEGYLLYTMKWGPGENPVKIAEWVSTSDGAWRALVGFLASLREQATVATYNGPRDNPLLLALREPYSAVGGSAEFIFFQTARLVSGFMLRVVHLASALEARPYPPELQAELVLRVEDAQLPANSRPVYVHIADGTASVAPARGLFPEQNLASVETDIATFSQLFAGFVSAEQARQIGRLHADDATCAQLTRAFAASPLYMHRSDIF